MAPSTRFRGFPPETREFLVEHAETPPSRWSGFERASYATRDWSLGGVLLSGYRGEKQKGEEVEAEVSTGEGAERYAFKATVVRRSAGSGRVALHFTELSDGAFALLEDLSTGRLRRARARCRRPSAD